MTLGAVAEAAARAAADELVTRFYGEAVGVATKSTSTDLVSEADLAAERAIRATLAELAPDDAIMGEEGADTPGTSGRRWVVDPLDGTINYLYGNPQWCISVACEGLAGVVLDPLRDECFVVGDDGAPARVRDRELRGSTLDDLGGALVATGFGYDAAIRARQAPIAARVVPAVRDLRRGGSAALDLAWCAAGRLDAYWEYGVQAWDIAAGVLLCERAGLVVERLPGDDVLPPGVLVAPGGIVDALRELVGP